MNDINNLSGPLSGNIPFDYKFIVLLLLLFVSVSAIISFSFYIKDYVSQIGILCITLHCTHKIKNGHVELHTYRF